MASTHNSLSEKRTLAHDLFMRTEKTQKEIARIVGVGGDTISDWVRKGRWKELKAANSVTRSQVINNTLLQIKSLQDLINTRAPMERFPSPKESDTLIKMGNLIRDLDKSLSLPDYLMVMEEMLKWLNEIKPELAKPLAPYILEFAQTKARQISQ